MNLNILSTLKETLIHKFHLNSEITKFRHFSFPLELHWTFQGSTYIWTVEIMCNGGEPSKENFVMLKVAANDMVEFIRRSKHLAHLGQQAH
jgi:hypothetical protein